MPDEFLGAFFDDLWTILRFDRHRYSRVQNGFITTKAASDTYQLRTRFNVRKIDPEYYQCCFYEIKSLVMSVIGPYETRLQKDRTDKLG